MNATKMLSLPALKRALTALFIFTLPPLIYFGNTSYGYTKAIFALVGISILLVVWGIEMVMVNGRGKRKGKGRSNGYRFNKTELFLPALLLILALTVSAVVNASFGNANLGLGLESLGLIVYYLLLYLVVANLVTRRSDLLLILGSLFASAVLVSSYGLLQYYGFEIFPYPFRRISGGPSAMISTLGNRNFLAGFLAYLVIPSLILLFSVRRRISKALVLLGVTVIYTTLFATHARGPLMGLIAGGIFFIGGLAFLKVRKPLRVNWRWTTALIVLLIGATALFWSPNSLNRSRRSATQEITTAFDAGSADTRTRFYDWWVTWEMIKDEPIIGIGLGNYKRDFLYYKAQFIDTERGAPYADYFIHKANQAHNEYVQVWAETGTLGLLATAAVVLLLFRTKIRDAIKAKSEQDRLVLWGLLSGVVALFAHATVSFPLHLPASSLALVVILGLLHSRYFIGERYSVELSRRGAGVIAVLLLFIAVSVSWFAAQDFISNTYFKRGRDHFLAGDLAAAQRDYEEALDLEFQPSDLLFALGVIERRKNNLEASEFYFNSSLDAFTDVNTFLNLGLIQRKRGDLQDDQALAREYYLEAIPYFEQAIVLDPTHLDARYLKAQMLLKAGEFEAGAATLQELLARDPSYARAYIELGNLYRFQANRHTEAGNLQVADALLKEATVSYREALKVIERKVQDLRERFQGRTLAPSAYNQVMGEIDSLGRMYVDGQIRLGDLYVRRAEVTADAETATARQDRAIASYRAALTAVEGQLRDFLRRYEAGRLRREEYQAAQADLEKTRERILERLERLK